MHARLAAILMTLLALVATPAEGRIDVTLDAESLNGLLQSMAPDQVKVGLSAGTAVTIRMEDLKITRFDPTVGQHGGVMTSLRLLVPELGIDMPVEPLLTLDILPTTGGRKASFLRFDKVVVKLPMTGAVDVAALLPPLALMPDAGWIVNSARGKVRVRPNLVDAVTGTKNIRLGFTLELESAEP